MEVHCILFPIVLAHPGAILAWQCGDVPGACIKIGHSSCLCSLCCPFLQGRKKTTNKPNKFVCTPKKSDSNWKRAQEVETCHQCEKGWEREIMAGSPDTTISWQETSACASQITSQSKKAQSIAQHRGVKSLETKAASFCWPLRENQCPYHPDWTVWPVWLLTLSKPSGQ